MFKNQSALILPTNYALIYYSLDRHSLCYISFLFFVFLLKLRHNVDQYIGLYRLKLLIKYSCKK